MKNTRCWLDCVGVLERSTTEFTVRPYGFTRQVSMTVPCKKCNVCGDVVFEAKDSEEIDRLLEIEREKGVD